ncbi:ATP-sensitive inward rectifier potassium channel 11-like [Malaya genurostris]|uniref:ATP-sensitive inward rectifier potassium channel 11-like n=1 Tax=Malaya genurostris TaxID=325434 RepID=UPI0026F3DDF8|nr:ATP-sensitive inward rectifier potassium channel 11-like [Malaya genurostris]
MSLDTLESSSASPYAHGKQWRRRETTKLPESSDHLHSRPVTIVNYNRQESFDLFTSPGSPYHIRKPVAVERNERSRLWVEQQFLQQKLKPHGDIEWKSSQESDINLNDVHLDEHLQHHPHHHQHHHHHHHDPHSQQQQHRHRRHHKHDPLHHGQNPSTTFPGSVDEAVGPHPHEEQLQFPIILQSARNMQHIRQRLRRDPEHQGTRAIRSTRVINKAGERNVLFLHLPQKSVRFVKDLVTTLVEEQWRYTLTVFVLSFVCSWILFAILWYLVAYAHGDLNFDPETGDRLGEGTLPCVEGATTFVAFLLFSIETQVSTGYGAKTPTEECPEALFLLAVQIIVGLVIDAAMIGIVYAKMVRPPKKISDMKFSKRAVICQRDGKLCFVFRLCDLKHQHAIETKISTVMLEQRRSLEGELIEKHESTMKLENNGRILLMWPVTVCHVIDSESPLFDISAKDLLQKRFEIVVTLSGGTMTTGQVNEARTSYLPGEIYWGHRFINIIHYDRTHDHYVARNELMDSIEPVDTPLCSARRLEEVLDEVHQFMDNDRHREFDGLECRSINEEDGQEDSDSDGGIQIEQLKATSLLLNKDAQNSNQPDDNVASRLVPDKPDSLTSDLGEPKKSSEL